ncbi:MAG: 4-demethylwyosine synthase TYW1, partial [Candidatus Thermoplasmatota archaeon]|nr:4-demethylwyosine synthase TYW1 [Candidatus Thermoplasmatota archaeon]
MDGSESLGDDIVTVPGYQAAGRHSAVKVCFWTAKSLTEGRGCYKSRFYGIESHRCLQMSPAADSCNLHCRFCWRDQAWEYSDSPPDFDSPEDVLSRSLEAQRALLSGYGGDPRVDSDRFAAALEPRHVAVSLTGEPTLYPRLSEYLALCHAGGMTTFLVTNGTHPDALRALKTLPTQLYISVTAPNREIFERLTHPPTPDAWESLLESLSIVHDLPTRRVLRHTVVKGWNLGWEEQYARLDSLAEPDFIEIKAYAFMGRSRHRLTRDNVPSMEEIRRFSQELSRRLGYRVEDESEEGNVRSEE